MSTPTSAARRSLATVLSAAAVAVALLLGTPHAVADLYRTPAGTYEVKGAILGEYRALGGPSGRLGYPLSNELTTPIRTEGRYSVFQHGSIYWTPSTGAHEVRGAIRHTWAWLGWENSAIGFPVTRELPTPDARGRFNYFERGSIYWTPTTGAHEVRGAILDKWASLGWELSPLGYPITSELGTPIKPGRYNHFERGSIYWSPETGSAVAVTGVIRDQWATLGWENSCLGFPLFDAGSNKAGGYGQSFQGGFIALGATPGEFIVSC